MFTETKDGVNITGNELSINCMTSLQNKFNLDSEGNLTVNSITTNQTSNQISQELINVIYPVGSIYISVDSKDPNLLFGGTWEQIKDRFLLATGDTYSNGTVGGEEKHTITIEEMPTHTHHIGVKAGTGGWIYPAMSDGAATAFCSTNAVGSSLPHNNMPPYLTVYMWKRIS